MLERLQKIIARAGIASRRHAEELIASGMVTVNGTTVTELGSKADETKDHIKVQGKLLQPETERAYLILNKPPEVVSTMVDPEGRRCLRDLLHGVSLRVFPVGRLEYHSMGLVFLTNDGELANQMLKAHYLPQTYNLKLKTLLTFGEVETLSRQTGAHIIRIKGKDSPWYEVTLSEARRDELRNKLFQTGHPVEKIKRIKIGNIAMESLTPGAFRPLSDAEVATLRRMVDPKNAAQAVAASTGPIQEKLGEKAVNQSPAQFTTERRPFIKKRPYQPKPKPGEHRPPPTSLPCRSRMEIVCPPCRFLRARRTPVMPRAGPRISSGRIRSAAIRQAEHGSPAARPQRIFWRPIFRSAATQGSDRSRKVQDARHFARMIAKAAGPRTTARISDRMVRKGIAHTRNPIRIRPAARANRHFARKTAALMPRENPAASITDAANLWAAKPARRNRLRLTLRRSRRDHFRLVPKAARNGDRTSASSTNRARKNLNAMRRTNCPRRPRDPGPTARGRKTPVRHPVDSTARSPVLNRAAQAAHAPTRARNIADGRIAHSGIRGQRLRDAPILARSRRGHRARDPARRFAAKNLRSPVPLAGSTKPRDRNHSASPARLLAPESREQGSRDPAESVRPRAASREVLSNRRDESNFSVFSRDDGREITISKFQK